MKTHKCTLQYRHCQSFSHTQGYCGYAPQCFAWGELACQGNALPHSSNLHGAAVEETKLPTTGSKWSGSRLKERLLSGRPLNAVWGGGGETNCPAAPKVNGAEPSPEQENPGPCWNHDVHGAVLSRLHPQLTPNPLPARSLHSYVE